MLQGWDTTSDSSTGIVGGKKKKGSVGRMFSRRPKLAWLGRIIRSLAFCVIRQRASKPPLVPKNLCADCSSSGMVLQEATSAHDGIFPAQLRRAYRMASIGSESEATYYDCLSTKYIELNIAAHTSGRTTINATRTSNNNSAYREK